MLSSDQFSRLLSGLAALGARRLVLLGLVGLSVMAAVVTAAVHLGRPAMQPIYTGLSAQDVSRITAALAEAGISFDVNEQRSAVMVPFGQTARARSLLAQKGLPNSSRAGYELFDQMGSIGLTSFMQEVTRVRALEGEIARTIQALDGVGAARVHLVLADPGSFRRERRDPSASVLLRLDERWQNSAAQAVRHIVAAAVPGMKIEQVNVAATDGRLLASGGDELTLGTAKHAEMERSMAAELEQRVSRTLSAVLGSGNYQVSATVRLDVDRQQVNETVFDPKSRIERSVRTVKQSGQSEDSGSKPAVGVVANLPKEESAQADGEKRRQREDRREELVNYELNTKTTQTVREGYRVKRQAIAVVISRKHLTESLGGGATPEAQEARLAELKRLVAAATGSSAEREDVVEIAAVDLTTGDNALAPVSGPGIKDYLMMNAGTAMNALAMLGVVFLVVWFGLRPVTRVLSQQPAIALEGTAAPALENQTASADVPAIAPPQGGIAGALTDGTHEGALQQLPRRKNNAAMREKLEALVESDAAEVTKVLKGWMQSAKAT
ncbi:MAG TPA: flagellar basal-body MS-ring/collar protein FliF [Hyphomicrobiaceae bacterium]|nr:flagellar basal-body MS-ring/collar protein FliF [Hyphomicrobiaceae bacterium]